MNHSVRVSRSIHPQNALLFFFLPVSNSLKGKQKMWQKISQSCRCFHYWIPEIMIENCSILFSLSGRNMNMFIIVTMRCVFFGAIIPSLSSHMRGESLHSVTTPDCYFFRFSWNFQSTAVQTEAKATGLQSVNLELEKREKQSKKKNKFLRKFRFEFEDMGMQFFVSKQRSNILFWLWEVGNWRDSLLWIWENSQNIAFCSGLSDRQIFLAKYFFNKKVFEIIQKLQNVSSSMNPSTFEEVVASSEYRRLSQIRSTKFLSNRKHIFDSWVAWISKSFRQSMAEFNWWMLINMPKCVANL